MEEFSQISRLVEEVQRSPVPVGPYLLRKVIGRGTFLTVFRGTCDEFGNLGVAVKLPHNQEGVEDIKTRRIVLSALGRCRHSTNLVYQGDYEGLPIIAEDLMDESLAEVIARGKLGLEQVIGLGAELLRGIDYFHRLKETNPVASQRLGLEQLTHCDVKPSNILQSTDVSGRIVRRYTDFGIRKREGAQGKSEFVNSFSTSSVRDGKTTSTRNVFAAPEVRDALLMGEEPPATVQADVWSIGAVLYYAVTGRAPIWGQTSPGPLGNAKALETFFTRILAGGLDQRYSSAQEALKGLDQCFNYDSLAVGIGHGAKKNYVLFAQPLKDGLPMGSTRRKEIDGDPADPPRLIYVPGARELVVVTKVPTKDGAPRYTVSAYDSSLIERRKVEIGQGTDEGPIKDVTLVRNKNDRRLVLRVERAGAQSIVYLPRMQVVHGAEDYNSTAPGRFFCSWQQLDAPRTSPTGKSHVEIVDNTIYVVDKSSRSALDINHVLDVMWVPK